LRPAPGDKKKASRGHAGICFKALARRPALSSSCQGAEETPEKAGLLLKILKRIPQGMNRLRKKSERKANLAQDGSAGLKPDSFC
jgi:hypothetical protein